MHVFVYFLHLVPTFPPHDIIAENGLLTETYLKRAANDLGELSDSGLLLSDSRLPLSDSGLPCLIPGCPV